MVSGEQTKSVLINVEFHYFNKLLSDSDSKFEIETPSRLLAK